MRRFIYEAKQTIASEYEMLVKIIFMTEYVTKNDLVYACACMCVHIYVCVGSLGCLKEPLCV